MATCPKLPELAVVLEGKAPALSPGIGNCRNLSLRWRQGTANPISRTLSSARHAARVDVGLGTGWIADFGAGFGTGRIAMLGVGTNCIALLGADVVLTTGMNAALGFSAGIGTCKMVALCLDTGFGIGRIASLLGFVIARALATAFVTNNNDCPEDRLPRTRLPGNMWDKKRSFGHSPHAALPTCG